MPFMVLWDSPSAISPVASEARSSRLVRKKSVIVNAPGRVREST